MNPVQLCEQSSRYRCVQKISKQGYTFIPGRIYFNRLTRSDVGIPLDKDGGGVVTLSPEEIASHFVQVVSLTCASTFTIGETKFTQGKLYWVASGKNDTFVIFPDTTDAEVAVTVATIGRRFRTRD